MPGLDQHTAQPGYGDGMTPLQRWLDEDIRDGGAMPLSLGYQLRIACTCAVMVENMLASEDAVEI